MAKKCKKNLDASARPKFLVLTGQYNRHGCTGHALASGWVGEVGSMDVVMVWARMHWPMDGLVAWALSWFGHDANLSDKASGANPITINHKPEML